MNPILIDAIGYIAAAASIFVYVSNTMIPLRIAAIVSSALFAVYCFFTHDWPNLALNAFLVPVNVLRLVQMQRLIADMRAATAGDFDFEWLRPYMKPVRLPRGVTLHRSGDIAQEAYVLVRGEIELIEPRVTLHPGALFGELGLFTDENRRLATAVAATDVDLLCIGYDALLELAAQNPQFGYYLMRLMMQRMQHNLELASAGVFKANQNGEGATMIVSVASGKE